MEMIQVNPTTFYDLDGENIGDFVACGTRIFECIIAKVIVQ
jgi:hypothetical protein